MQTIWKYKLEPHGTLEMPKGAEVLTVQSQFGDPVLWALVDPEAEKERRAFFCVGTGHPITTPPGKYIGTFQIEGGALIFHVFEN